MMFLANRLRRAGAAKKVEFAYVTNVVATTAAKTTFTFNSVPLGAAAPGRIIVLAVTGAMVAGSTRSVTSVTLGGNTVPIRVNSGSGVGTAAMAANTIASGTSADIVVTFSAEQLNCSVAVYALYGFSSPVPTATAVGVGSVNVAVSAKGAIFGANVRVLNGTEIHTWGNLDKNYENNYVSSGTNRISGASRQFANAGTINVTCSSSSVLIAGAWR